MQWNWLLPELLSHMKVHSNMDMKYIAMSKFSESSNWTLLQLKRGHRAVSTTYHEIYRSEYTDLLRQIPEEPRQKYHTCEAKPGTDDLLFPCISTQINTNSVTASENRNGIERETKKKWVRKDESSRNMLDLNTLEVRMTVRLKTTQITGLPAGGWNVNYATTEYFSDIALLYSILTRFHWIRVYLCRYAGKEKIVSAWFCFACVVFLSGYFWNLTK